MDYMMKNNEYRERSQTLKFCRSFIERNRKGSVWAEVHHGNDVFQVYYTGEVLVKIDGGMYTAQSLGFSKSVLNHIRYNGRARMRREIPSLL
jgi:hypothetical protein